MEKLSAVILTFNEERNIGRCIQSVQGIVDEIVVVDSFSTDKTAEICRSFGARFISHPFEGYVEQKNYAMQQAGNDLILSLDADECLSRELADSIIEVKHKRDYPGYMMNRLTNYCGKWIRHSGWYPDTKLRLFDRREGHWGGTNPHDKFMLHHGLKTGMLKGDLLHYSYYTIAEHKAQVIKFADISAGAMYKQGDRSNWLKIFIKPVARFLRTYIVKGGYRDGREGWTIAGMTAWGSYLRYSKLYRLQKKA